MSRVSSAFSHCHVLPIHDIITSNSALADPVNCEVTDSTSYEAYLMIFDSNTISDDSKFYLTETKSFTTYAGADDSVKVSWGSQYSNTTVAGGWASATGGVPEPTSGLLLLIGGAMLALRRKQK